MESVVGQERDTERWDAPAMSGSEVDGVLAQVRPATDLGNAERLAERAKHKLQRVHGIGWIAWDGKRWQRDTTGKAMREAAETARSIYGDATRLNATAERATDEDDRKRLSDRGSRISSWAVKSESRRALEAMLALGASQKRLVVEGGADALDADPNALNVQNGILDLRTFELAPHDPERLLTRIATAAYDANAGSPFWKELVELVLPDPDVRRWVQKAAGYSMLGSFSEYLFIPWGDGANGKSTFLSALRGTLGDYATEANSELLASKREMGAAAESALAGLRGARLVTSVETEQGRRMAEVLVKQLTGEAQITAKFMRQDYFTFTNQAAVWLATNHKPVVQGMDHAIWRRIRLIPFEATIPLKGRLHPAEVNQRLRAERDGILLWLIEGLRGYRGEGLDPAPDVVTQATAVYQEEMDPLREWMDDRCAEQADAFTASAKLRSSYEGHCGETGRHPLAAQRFNQELARRGFREDRRSVDGKQVRGRWGIALMDYRDIWSPSQT